MMFGIKIDKKDSYVVKAECSPDHIHELMDVMRKEEFGSVKRIRNSIAYDIRTTLLVKRGDDANALIHSFYKAHRDMVRKMEVG